MKKTKLEKGITLIALIITIVVLLILAAVTIGTIQKSKIITHAQNAASDYTIAQEKELIGIGYSEYLIEKNISKDVQLKVEGAQVTPVENTGWEIVFSETNSKYQVDKSGTITYIEEGEDAGDIAIPVEKDLTIAAYIYNTMYNPEQPEIVCIDYCDDENGDKISDINPYLNAYKDSQYYNIQNTFFNETIPEEGDIAAKITHLDGTEEEIILTTTDNKEWTYESLEESLLINGSNIEISFCPNSKNDYHRLQITNDNVTQIHKLEMFGKIIEFPYNCQGTVGIVDTETGEVESMYNDINNVNKVTVNFSDGSNQVYIQDNLFSLDEYTGTCNYFYPSKEVILYTNGGFMISMPEASLKTQITSVVVEENGVVTKYNVTDSTTVMHMRQGT